ncbi:MAG TPA: CHASE3 domain-containing protein [Caulobacteraceae bacterium]|nr:CHASE3 domain-containing protein [Caulobacteraceae bacterium]
MAATGFTGEQGGLRRDHRFPVVVAFCLLALAGLAAVAGVFTAQRADQRSAHSLQVRQVNARLFSAVQDAETGQRGFLLTGDPDYLAPFTRTQAELPLLRSELRELTRDNAAQQARLDRLYPLIDAKMAELAQTIALRNDGHADAAVALVRTDLGRNLMQQIRAIDEAFDTAEAMLLDARQARARELGGTLNVTVPVAVAIAGVLVFLLIRASARYETELENRNRSLAAEMAQREQAEAQLRQAQKMEALGQLTGGVAHDFNNMLAIIVGNLDILRRRLPLDQPRLKAAAENALTGANRATALTQRLLAFSRLQPLDPKPTDINKCVSDMSEMLRRTLGETIVVETVLAGGLWRAFIDNAQLESALLNLGVNARDAMPADGGKLTLETSNAYLDQAYADQHAEVNPGQYVLVAVTDTGTGMTPEVMDKAFDPFFTTKGVGAGTGLGLSQVHGFLKQSKGHVKLYGEVGVGTTVKLYLPRDVSGQAAAAQDQALPGAAIGQRFTVLVVEDDAGVRQVAVGAVRELGFKVIEADSAAAALERLGEHPEVSVLLTDVVMPVTDGRRLAEAALVDRPDLRVLYMTGYTRNAIVHNGVLDAGARLLTKPFTVEQLDRELRAILSDQI